MAKRAIKTKSPKQVTRDRVRPIVKVTPEHWPVGAWWHGPQNRVALDLCRIRPDRVRALSTPALKIAQARVGSLHMLPKKETGGWRWTFSHFMNAIEQCRTHSAIDDPKDVAIYARRFPGEKRAPNAVIKAMYCKMADEDEQTIKDLQERAGCKLAPYELVARDLEKEDRRDEAQKLRAEHGRPRRTPHRRPAKIR